MLVGYFTPISCSTVTQSAGDDQLVMVKLVKIVLSATVIVDHTHSFSGLNNKR
jgi:hypothetical protein